MVHFLKDDKVVLRKLSLEDDMENYLEFVNDADNLKWIEGIGNFPLNKEDLAQYISSNKNLFLSIFNNKRIHVGNVRLSHIDFIHRSAMLGVLVGRRFEGQGYATRACKLVVAHAFEVLNLHRIYLTVITGNKNAIALYEKLGFIKEGVKKESHYYNFKYHDGITYRLLESEYWKIRNAVYDKRSRK